MECNVSGMNRGSHLWFGTILKAYLVMASTCWEQWQWMLPEKRLSGSIAPRENSALKCKCCLSTVLFMSCFNSTKLFLIHTESVNFYFNRHYIHITKSVWKCIFSTQKTNISPSLLSRPHLRFASRRIKQLAPVVRCVYVVNLTIQWEVGVKFSAVRMVFSHFESNRIE